MTAWPSRAGGRARSIPGDLVGLSGLVLHVFVPVFLMAGLLVISLARPGAYGALTREDGLIEYATAVCYFVAFLAGLLLTRRVLAKADWPFTVLYGCMAVAFLVACLEEISWGQRIFQIEASSFFREQNIQREIGIHNLQGLHALLHPAYIVVGFTGAFGVIVPSRILNGPGRAIVTRLLPSPHLFLYFFPCFAYYLVAELLSPFTTIAWVDPDQVSRWFPGRNVTPEGLYAVPAHLLDGLRSLVPFDWLRTYRRDFAFWRHQESFELLLSMGFLLFVRERLRHESSRPSTS
jgi:hypothetical protein